MSTSNSSTEASPKKPVKKTLCDWSKRELKEHFDQLQQIVAEPCWACLKCGRAASAKKWLCKAKKLG